MRKLFSLTHVFMIVIFWNVLSEGANSAAIRIAPISLDLKTNKTGTLILDNKDHNPITVQVRTFAWNQDVSGFENLEPTSSIAASPPIVRIPPKGRYTIRVVRLLESLPTYEENYRLYVDEIPTRSTKQNMANIIISVRHIIPVFFGPQTTSSSKLEWSLVTGSKPYLLATNRGGSRAQISNLEITKGSNTTTTKRGLVGYVLAGSSRRIYLPKNGYTLKPGDSVAISAQNYTDKINTRVIARSSP